MRHVVNIQIYMMKIFKIHKKTHKHFFRNIFKIMSF